MIEDTMEPLPNTPGRFSTLLEQGRALTVVLGEEFGVPFVVYHALSGESYPGEGEVDPDLDLAPDMVQDLASEGRVRVDLLPQGRYRLTVLLYLGGRPTYLAAGILPALALPEDHGREGDRLRRWGQAVSDRLRLNDQLFDRSTRADDTSPALANGQATAAWEALLTVDHLIRRMRIHKDAWRNRRRVLEAAFGLIPARTLVWVPSHPGEEVVLFGEPCLAAADARHLASCLGRAQENRTPEPIFSATVPVESWGQRFPGVVNLMALALTDGGGQGWVIALNKKCAATPSASGLPTAFRRSDAALLTPFVGLLELHGKSSQRYQDLKDLLVGLTRSLTAALDAKDSYTYGHSERVARIAVELGRELNLGADDLSDIYLAGLLHDVGKIGIKDAILLKPGPLTADEYEHIKQHVTIGYTILADLHPIRNLLPGVLWHHERWDGRGYPDGLAGESIPLLARILAVADAYDAMSTPRPYREALPFRKVEEILGEGGGSQWDGRVVDAFLRCRQKIHAIRQRGVGESLHAAIDGALRSSEASQIWPQPKCHEPPDSGHFERALDE